MADGRKIYIAADACVKQESADQRTEKNNFVAVSAIWLATMPLVPNMRRERMYLK